MTDDSLGGKPEPPSSLPLDSAGPQELLVDADPPRGPAEAAEMATADLVERLGIDAGQITTVTAAEHTWNDGSLGCPVPGRLYTQSLVPGFRVILSAAGDEFAYHAATGRGLFYCPNPTSNVSSGT